MGLRKTFWIVAIATSTVIYSPANASEGPLELVSFRFGKLLSVMDSNATTALAQFAWTPHKEFSGIELRGDVGMSFFREGGGKLYTLFSIEALAGIPLVWILRLEGGGGLQLWSLRGNAPALSANLAFAFPDYLDRIYVGYSRVFLKSDGANQLRIAAGFTF